MKNITVLNAPYNDNSNDHAFIQDIVTNVFHSDDIESLQLPQTEVRYKRESLAQMVEDIFQKGSSLITLSDNHTVSLTQISKWIDYQKNQNKRYAIIQFDNHANLNQVEEHIGHNNKNWATGIIDELNKPSDLIQVGIDFSSQPDGMSYEVNQFSSESIHTDIAAVTRNIIDYLEVEKVEKIYLSLDMSVMDADYIGPNPKLKNRGLEPHHFTYILSAISQKFNVDSADICEVHLMPHHKNNFLLNPQPHTTRINAYLLGGAIKEYLSKWQ